MGSKIDLLNNPLSPIAMERGQENHKCCLPEVRREAHRLLDLGFTPLPAVPELKRPPFSWKIYQANPPTHDELDRLFNEDPSATGLGIVTTGLVIIDVDALPGGLPNPFPNDPNQRLTLSQAPAVRSAGGGTHFYFRANPDRPIMNSASKLAPKVDVRSNGGFLVIPPTVRGTAAYTYVVGRRLDVPAGELPVIPDFVLDLLSETPVKPTVKQEEMRLNGEILEGARNDTLFRMASRWRGMGHSEREIYGLTAIHNHDRCIPRLDDGEVRLIARSASKYQPNEPAEPVVEHPDPGPIPDELLSIPGFVNDVIDLTMSTAPRPNRPLAFAGSLVLLATLAGRKVRSETDLRTNIYIVAIGISGIGKDHPRKVNKRIMFELGLGEAVIGSVASGQALEDEVTKTPACLAMTDEMDELLMAIRKDQSGTRQNLPKVMMELFTSASGPYQARARANQDRVHVDQPNLCVFGTAVPDRFYESISARMMDDGFMGRALIIEAGAVGPRQKCGAIKIPQKILDVGRYWAGYGQSHKWDKEHPSPTLVPCDGDANAVLEQAAGDFDEERERSYRNGDMASCSIWSRAWEHAAKLSLLYAISFDHQKPIVTRDAAMWAVRFVGHHARRLIASVHGRVAENEFHATLIKAKAKLRAAPKRTMSRSRLMKNMHISKRDLDQVIDVLVESREIEVLNGSPASPNERGTSYRLVSE